MTACPQAETFMATPGLHAKLWNMYGATEAGCTYFVCEKGDEARLLEHPEGVPAGVPQCYVDVFIMEESAGGDGTDPLSPVATGQVGEICFGGGGPAGFLARGYWRRQDLTDKVFIETKSYGRIYRTGDAGQWRNGEVVVCGRLDRQVKVHGVRTQPESIEAVLKRYSIGGEMPIKACLVVPTQHEPIELVAFLESGSTGGPVDTSAVRAFLGQELGRLYVPKHIVHLVEGLPRTASGKPDQNILKRLASQQEDGEGSGVAAPLDEIDEATDETGSSTLSTVLGEPQLGPDGGCVSWNVDLRLPAWKPLSDHRYRGEAIFPGSGYVAIAAEVCQSKAWPGWELQDLVFSKALALEDGTPRPLRVTAVPIEMGVEITIASLPHAGDWITHCTCRGVRLDAAAVAEYAAPDEADASTHQDYPVKQLYAEMADGGFDYGLRFQAVTSVFLQSTHSGGGIIAHRDSPFVLDFVTVDVCFHISPLLSALGFQGAPVRIGRIQCFENCPEKATDLHVSVTADDSTSLLDFQISSSDSTLFTVEGLGLQPFDALPAEPLRVRSGEYMPSTEVASTVPRVVALSESATSHAETLARELGTQEVCTWSGEKNIGMIPLRTVALVVSSEEDEMSDVEALLLTLQQELPWRGRMWLVVVGDGKEHWQSRGRLWSVSFPALLLSVLSVRSIDRACVAPLLDLEAPPCISNGRVWSLELFGEGKAHAVQLCGKTLRPEGQVLVLAAQMNPVVRALLKVVETAGGVPKLMLPGEEPPADSGDAVAMLCAIGPASVQCFETICAAAASCVTIASMEALLPSVHSCRASASAQAARLSRRRVESGHDSWTVFVPPLFDGLWFEPPAPAGFHRCSVDTLVRALAGMSEVTDTIVGTPPDDSIPKHYARIATVSSMVVRGEADVREFLLQELAEQLKVDATELGTETGLDDLGVTSLLSLRLSQRLRRFIGHEFSPFVLSRNPTIAELAQNLTDSEAAGSLPAQVVAQSSRGRVLCLHGYRTSSTVLQQQMSVQSPLGTDILQRLGYDVLVPNGTAPLPTRSAAANARC